MLADERPVAQLGDGLLELGLRVHDDGPVPGDRLPDRPSRHQKEPDALLAGLDRHLIAAVEEDERTVAGLLADQDLVAVDRFLGEHAQRLRREAE